MLERPQTASEAFHGNGNGKGTPSGVPQPIHKRKLVLVKEEFDASSFGGAEGVEALSDDGIADVFLGRVAFRVARV